MNLLRLVTSTIELQITDMGDLDLIHALLSIPEVDKYNALGIPTNTEVTTTYLQEWIDNYQLRREFVFWIKDVVSGTNIGLISLRIGTPKYKIGTIWYKLFPEVWGKGYATEAGKEILRFGFDECGLHRIEAGCAIDNIGSFRVLEKIGMIKEGHKRKVLPLKTGWSDSYEFAILKEDWEKGRT